MSQPKIHIIICILSIVIACGILCIATEAFSLTFPFIGNLAVYQGVSNPQDMMTENVTLHITQTPVITPLPLLMPYNGNKKVECYNGGDRKYTPAPLKQQVNLEPCRGLATEETWTRINENIMWKCTKTPMCSMEGYFEKYQEDCKNVMTCSDNSNKGLNVADSGSQYDSCRPDSVLAPTVVITLTPVTQTQIPTPTYSNYQLPTIQASDIWVPATGLVSKSGFGLTTMPSSESSGKYWGSGGGSGSGSGSTGGSTGGGSSGGGVSGTPAFECPPGASCSYFGPEISSSAGSSGTMGPDNGWAAFNKVVTRNTTTTSTKGKVMTTPTKKISVNVTGTKVNVTITPVVTSLKGV